MPFRKLFGSVVTEIKNANIENILADFRRRGIRVSNLRRLSYTRISFETDMFSWRKIKKLPYARIIRKKGIIGLTDVFKRHAVLVCILCAGTAVIGIGAFMCLDTQVTGNNKISVPDIVEVVRENGGRHMRFKSQIDTDAITLALRRKFPEISYAHSYFDGVKLVIKIDEGVPMPEIGRYEPCDIVAAKDGIITDITVLSGLAVVKEGSVVKKGDTLIKGAYLINEKEIVTAANGIIKAAVTYEGEGRIGFSRVSAEETGNEETERWLKLGSRWSRIDGKNTYEEYTTEKECTAAAGKNSPLTLEIWDITYKETKSMQSDSGIEQARTAARETAYYDAYSKIPDDAEMITVKCSFDETEDSICARSVIITQENIGVKGKLSHTENEE